MKANPPKCQQAVRLVFRDKNVFLVKSVIMEGAYTLNVMLDRGLILETAAKTSMYPYPIQKA